MKYFLIGYMACGKTHRGRIMAKELGCRFIDLDAYITEREHRTIREIFAWDGEKAFRKMETRYLHEVCGLYEDFVLATGGGTPCHDGNMAYMNDLGETVFLHVDVDTLVGRLSSGQCRRPIVSGLESGELRDFVSRHLRERLPFYLQAKRVIRQ